MSFQYLLSFAVWIYALIQQGYLVVRDHVSLWISLTENKKFVDNTQQCFALTPQVKFKRGKQKFKFQESDLTYLFGDLTHCIFWKKAISRDQLHFKKKQFSPDKFKWLDVRHGIGNMPLDVRSNFCQQIDILIKR